MVGRLMEGVTSTVIIILFQVARDEKRWIYQCDKCDIACIACDIAFMACDKCDMACAHAI